MVRFIILLCVLLFLGGCANRWQHPTKRPSEFYADDRECQQIAGSATEAVDPRTERVSYESCMWDKGWTKKSKIWFFDPSDR
ncbi:MAG: hypothetical protein JRF07_07145 [Deltaproteobacteria bacterium]|jgi:hypothetical protein|nr:hypothetical protein [Deltaproteobacteria bacterium]MBW2477436.1 hypothetical protein [Deltaproteobacteria bacterium]